MPNSIQVFSLNGRQAPLEVSAKIEEGLDNFDSLFKCDIRSIINSIDAKIYYDPNSRKTKERGSYDWIHRKFYLSTVGVSQSVIHELSHMLDAEAGDSLAESLHFGSPLGPFLFRCHHNWYSKNEIERRLFEEYLCSSRNFIAHPTVPAIMLMRFEQKAEATQTWHFMTERFAQLIEEYSFYELANRNLPMIGVSDVEYYKNHGDLAGFEFISKHRQEIPLLIADRVARINERIGLGFQNEFHRERVDNLHQMQRMLESEMTS